ncbi:MAG: D-alanine--poly(phosphoribitol) ligase, partial [Acidobacteria bacterium]|nr:D-alanine--poly(phosphoribitol) ligase [Acidobacteriota bacterium]
MGDPLLAPILSRIEENPGRLAVVDGSGAWSRQELLCAADGYAAAIRESGVACKAIPLFCGRNKESVAAALGCLRAGRAFAPLSP